MVEEFLGGSEEFCPQPRGLEKGHSIGSLRRGVEISLHK